LAENSRLRIDRFAKNPRHLPGKSSSLPDRRFFGGKNALDLGSQLVFTLACPDGLFVGQQQ